MTRQEHVTPHFLWQELACHDGTPVPVELEGNALRLCQLLEAVRTIWGDSLIVVSGYRTALYNVRIGGAARSRHVVGDAADIRPTDIRRLPKLAALIRANLDSPALATLGGWGIYPSWVHVDTRPRADDGHIAFWVGSGIGSEQAA